MRIDGLIWFDDIIEKLISKHNVKQNEVREVLSSKPHLEKGHRSGEDVYTALGRSHSGRYLIVFFVHKTDKRTLILSARDMTKTERKLYGKT